MVRIRSPNRTDRFDAPSPPTEHNATPSPMTPFWPPLLIVLALLILPRLMMPRPTPLPEVHGHLRLLWYINRFYCGLWHRLELVNEAPLPRQGPALLIANHTCGIDNFLLQAGCDRVLGFVVTHEWYDFWLLKPFCRLIGAIPVRRDGRDAVAVRSALRALEEGRVVPIFPEGRINPDSGRSFLEPKPGAAFIALHSGAPVVPAYICGTPSTNNIWRALFTPSEARVVFGPPIDLTPYRAGKPVDRETVAEVTKVLMGAIRALRDRPVEDGTPAAAGAVAAAS